VKSTTYFSSGNSQYLKSVLDNNYDVQIFTEDPLSKGAKLYLPPGRICVVEDTFSAMGGIKFAQTLQEKYPRIIIVLCVEGKIKNETVKEAVAVAKVYRIISLEWPEENILGVMKDASSYSKEIKKNIFLLKEEENKNRRLVSIQQSLKNEEFLNVESLMYADQIVQYARSSVESYNQILSTIGSGKRSRELLDSIREKINRLVPVDAISLCFRSKRISSKEKLNISISFTQEKRDLQKLTALSKESYERIVKKLDPNNRNKITQFLDSNDGNSTLCEIIDNIEDSSSLIIPLIHQDKYMGNLVLFRFERPHFKKRELLIVEQFSEAGNIIARGFRNFEYYEKTKKEWESTFDAISDPVAIVDLNYNLVRVNKAFVKSSKFSIDSVVGEKCYRVLIGSDTPCPGCPLKKSVADREVRTCDELRSHDKKIYNVWSYPLETSDKEIKTVVLYYRNIVREKRLTTQLMEADKMAEIGILAGSVAHEINNPLGGILAFSQIILRELRGDREEGSQFYEDIKEIEAAALRGKKIVESLLNFSRMSRAEDILQIDIPDIIKTAISLVEYNAKLYNIRVKTFFPKKMPLVYGNYNQLIQVFLSIISSAMNSMMAESTHDVRDMNIRVKYDKAAARVVVRIIFPGKLISEDRISRIFNPNVLLHDNEDIPPDSTVEKRAGVGLTVSYGIIQDHNGTIVAKSDKKSGNEYVISLPVTEAKKTVSEPFSISMQGSEF